MIEEVNLADVCDIIAGQSPPSSTYNQEGNGVPFFQGKADFGETYPTVRYWCNSPKKMSKPDDILFSVRAPVGPTNINNIKACIGRGLAAIRCSNIQRNYLLHYLRGNEDKIASLGTGSTFKAITIGTLKELKIPLPPIDQQKKIAAILDAADAYRQKTKALILKYDELTQSLFLDMFGDETGSLTELGKIIKTFGGGTPSKDNEQYWNGNIPWASVKDLKSDRLNKTQDFITQAGVDNSATRVIPNGSLIVATRMAVGRAAICEMDVAINQDLKAIQLIGEINIMYLLYLFKSKENYFDSVSSGATVKGIKIEHITKLKINLPEIDLQNQFAERIQAIEAQKAQAKASLAGAEDLFNSLLQRAFKGELS